MDLQEAIDLKSDLEHSIRILLQDFTQQTHLVIDNIEMRHDQQVYIDGDVVHGYWPRVIVELR